MRRLAATASQYAAIVPEETDEICLILKNQKRYFREVQTPYTHGCGNRIDPRDECTDYTIITAA